jgi:homoserine O-acetyltransferase
MKITRGRMLSEPLCLLVLASTFVVAGGAMAQNETYTQGTGTLELNSDLAPKSGNAKYTNYHFRDGETLDSLQIHYVTLGTPHRNAQGQIDNAVLVLHWTGADGRAVLSPSYVKSLYGKGCPLDAQRYYIIAPDNLGHGQSSKPSDGKKAEFPKYGYGDMVDLQHKLVTETLGVKHLHAILGMSMGGMNVWQWAEAYPDMTDGVMPVVSLRCSPFVGPKNSMLKVDRCLLKMGL